MKTINQLRKRKGVSPVIATVILVAVTITVAVAVAYWMSGIAGQYTSFEKVEMPAHYSLWTNDVNRDASAVDGWNQYIELKNSGSKAASITNIFLNNIPLKDYTTIPLLLFYNDGSGEQSVTLTSIAIPLGNGEEVQLIICIPIGVTGCTSGTTIDLKSTTAAGNSYPILEVLDTSYLRR